MSKIQLFLDTFYIEFHTDKFANISKRYVSFAEKYDQDANIMMLKSRMLNKKNLSRRKKTNNQNYCLQTIVQCGAEIATSQIFMPKKFGLKSINQPEVTNN